MKTSPNRDGYPKASFTPTDGGQYKSFLVHRLVLLAFVGPCPDGMEARHLDGIKSNPSLYKATGEVRLAWGTHDENVQDNLELGAYPKGKARLGVRMTPDTVREIRRRHAEDGVSLLSLSREYHLSDRHLRNIVYRRRWQHIA